MIDLGCEKCLYFCCYKQDLTVVYTKIDTLITLKIFCIFDNIKKYSIFVNEEKVAKSVV